MDNVAGDRADHVEGGCRLDILATDDERHDGGVRPVASDGHCSSAPSPDKSLTATIGTSVYRGWELE